MKLIYLLTVYFLVDLKERQMVFCLGNLFLFFFFGTLYTRATIFTAFEPQEILRA